MDSTSPCSRGRVSALQNKCLFWVAVSWPLELLFPAYQQVWAFELHGKGKIWSLGERPPDSQPWAAEGWKEQGWCCNPLCPVSHCLVQMLGCSCLIATFKILGRTRSFKGTTDFSVHPGKASGCIWEIVTACHFYMGLQSFKFFFSGKDLQRIYWFFFFLISLEILKK